MVVLYTNHCTNCNMTRAVLEKMGVVYEICDDPNIYMPIAETHKITSMPFASIDGDIVGKTQIIARLRAKGDG